MQTLLFNLMAIALIGVIACAVYIWTHPQMFKLNPEPVFKPTTYENFYSINIQAFINSHWTIQALIRECEDMKEMEWLYWKIEEFEEEFKDSVPDQLLITHVDELYAYHTQMALMLRRKLKTVYS